MFGLYTTSQVDSIKQELRDYYELKLLQKDEIINKNENRFEIEIELKREMQKEIESLKIELENKNKNINFINSILGKIDKEIGKIYNTKSDRIKKKYAKLIEEKLEEI